MCKVVQNTTTLEIYQKGFKSFVGIFQVSREGIYTLFPADHFCALELFKVSGGRDIYEYHVFERVEKQKITSADGCHSPRSQPPKSIYGRRLGSLGLLI